MGKEIRNNRFSEEDHYNRARQQERNHRKENKYKKNIDDWLNNNDYVDVDDEIEILFDNNANI